MKQFRDLKVRLTEEEWAANASALAQAQQDHRKLEEEFATVKSTYKGRLETIAERAEVVGEKVRSREETRAVEVFDRNDDRRFVVETFRADLGTLVDTRPMTANERQLAMQPRLPGVIEDEKEELAAAKFTTVIDGVEVAKGTTTPSEVDAIDFYAVPRRGKKDKKA